ncbi:hypothetical protein D3C84_1248150 [compost metagenome]
MRVWARHAHEWSHVQADTRHAYLPSSLQGIAAVFHVDVDRIETCRVGNAGDIKGSDKPRGHRIDRLAPGELFFDPVPE